MYTSKWNVRVFLFKVAEFLTTTFLIFDDNREQRKNKFKKFVGVVFVAHGVNVILFRLPWEMQMPLSQRKNSALSILKNYNLDIIDQLVSSPMYVKLNI